MSAKPLLLLLTCLAGVGGRTADFISAWGAAPGLGDGDGVNRTEPVRVTSPDFAGEATAVAAGHSHGLAIVGGRVFGWGSNGRGELGDGTRTFRVSPVAVVADGALAGQEVAAISAGTETSFALSRDGRVFAWGTGFTGSLGQGDTADSHVPVAVAVGGPPGAVTVTAISASSGAVLALTTDGHLFAWGGRAASGIAGNGTGGPGFVTTPTAVRMDGALAGRRVTVLCSCDPGHLVATEDGRIFWWGRPGALAGEMSAEPVELAQYGSLIRKRVVALASSGAHTLAVTDAGELHAWGENGSGQIGNRTVGGRIETPVRVHLAEDSRVKAASAGGSFSMALTSAGEVFAWGSNFRGTLGTSGSPVFTSTPLRVHDGPGLAGQVVEAVSAGSERTLALSSTRPRLAIRAEPGGSQIELTLVARPGRRYELQTQFILEDQPAWSPVSEVETDGAGVAAALVQRPDAAAFWRTAEIP